MILVCPKCGSIVSETDATCSNCKYQLNSLDNKPQSTKTLQFDTLRPVQNISFFKDELWGIWNGFKVVFGVGACIILFIAFISGYESLSTDNLTPVFQSSYVSAVQNGSPKQYSYTTYKKAFDKYFEDTKWESIGNGSEFVKFTGIYNNGTGLNKFVIEFEITTMRESIYFEPTYLSIDNVDQNQYVLTTLIDKIFKNAR